MNFKGHHWSKEWLQIGYPLLLPVLQEEAQVNLYIAYGLELPPESNYSASASPWPHIIIFWLLSSSLGYNYYIISNDLGDAYI